MESNAEFSQTNLSECYIRVNAKTQICILALTFAHVQYNMVTQENMLLKSNLHLTTPMGFFCSRINLCQFQYTHCCVL